MHVLGRLGRNARVLSVAACITLLVALTLPTAAAQTAATPIFTWSVKTPMPQAGFALAMAAIAGKVYALGGTGSMTQNVEYDPLTGAWTPKAPMPTGRFSLAAVASQGVIYAIGGTTGGTAVDVVEVYHPVSDSWTTAAHLPVAIAGGRAVASAGGSLYVFGAGSVYRYTPGQDRWEAVSAMPVARTGFGLALAPNGLVYIIGGRVNGSPANTVDVYDPVANTWSTGTPMQDAIFNAVAVVLDDGRICVLGIGPRWPTAVALYDPAADQWSPLSYERPTSRDAFGAAAIGSRVYVAGGYTGSGSSPVASDVLEVGALRYPVYLPVVIRP